MKYTSLQNTEHKQEDHHDKQYTTYHNLSYFNKNQFGF
jgi:hypothetical protein